MVYLLLKITFCLLLAGILGALIGWFLKRIFAQKHNNEQQQCFDMEREQHKENLTQVESNWNTKYQSLNTTRNKIQGLLDISTQDNTRLSQSVKTTQQILNDQGEMLKRLQDDMHKLGKAKDELQNKNSLLAQEVVNLRNENKQIATLEDTLTHLNHTQSSLETTLKETKATLATNEAANADLLKKHHELEKGDTALKHELSSVIDERDRVKHTLAQLTIARETEQQKADERIIEKQQLLSIQKNEAEQQNKNKTTIIALRSTLEKTEKENRVLNNKVTTLQQATANISTLKAKLNSLEKNNQKHEQALQAPPNDAKKIKQYETSIELLKTDNALLKKDNQDNHKKNRQLNSSLSDMTSEIERYKRYLIKSEKTWAAKFYALQSQSKTVEKKPSGNKQLQEKITQLTAELDKATSSLHTNRNEKEQLQTHVTQLNKTLKTLTAKNRHTEASLSTIQQDYINLSEKHTALKHEQHNQQKPKPKIAKINKARADDLQKIKGIGKHNERILNKLGITHYAQIAHFTQQDEDKFGKKLGVFASRISQEAWVGQAKILHQDKYDEPI